MNNERKEAWMRIIVGIISGIILYVWRYLIVVFAIINFVYTIFAKKRLKELAEMSEIWNTQYYFFQRYMIFESNERPFPFTKLKKNISKFK
jgi:predicted DCC family thiol-disulfide oxidoreductase YuxK